MTSARDWVGLLEEYPHSDDGDLELNWSEVAAEVDAVHVTPDAVCAVDGFRMRTARGPSAPVYWDVEGTRWLRWSFDAAELVSDESTVPVLEE